MDLGIDRRHAQQGRVAVFVQPARLRTCPGTMDSGEYRQRFFTSPAPLPRGAITGIVGVDLMVSDGPRARAFYTTVLGPPAYVEDAIGWPIRPAWLTLAPGLPPENTPLGTWERAR